MSVCRSWLKYLKNQRMPWSLTLTFMFLLTVNWLSADESHWLFDRNVLDGSTWNSVQVNFAHLAIPQLLIVLHHVKCFVCADTYSSHQPHLYFVHPSTLNQQWHCCSFACYQCHCEHVSTFSFKHCCACSLTELLACRLLYLSCRLLYLL